MRLSVVQSNPPNILDIQLTLGEMPEDTVYCYGTKLYNPSRGEIPPDVEAHEAIHSRQQVGKPREWWAKYLNDPEFRLQQELEAYVGQYLFVKGSLGAKMGKDCLYDLAQDLAAPAYGLGITIHQAQSLIHHKARSMVK